MNTEETYNKILKEGWYPAKPNDMAFPCPDSQSGLTKREYFAAMAMQGMLYRKDDLHPVDMVAEKAVKQADALITQLNQQP